MSDYKDLYLRMFKATEEARGILISAQRECEELYLADEEPKLTVMRSSIELNKGEDVE